MASHITIGDVSPRIQYTADGVQAAFTYPFPIFENVDLEVYADAALQSTGYTISGAGDSAGGLVTFDTAPVSGVIVTLARRLNIQRTSDFQESGEFRSKVINDELDYLTASLQQVSDDQSRSLQMSITESKSVDTTLPTPVANMSIVWNDMGAGITNGPTIDEIANAQLYATSASTSSVAAATAAGQAATSESNAATSAATALAATVGKYDVRISITSADSPYTVSAMTQDTLLNVDTTGGAVVVNLPAASGEADNRLLGINKIGAANTVTIMANGADTIGGAASFMQYDDTEWADLYLDKTATDWLLGNLSFTAAGTGLTKTGSTIALDITSANTWTAPQLAPTLTDNDGTFDMSAKTDFICTPTGAITVQFTGETLGQRGMVRLDNSGGHAITMGAEVKSDVDAATSLSTAGIYTLGYWCYDGVNVDLTYSTARA